MYSMSSICCVFVLISLKVITPPLGDFGTQIMASVCRRFSALGYVFLYIWARESLIWLFSGEDASVSHGVQ